MVWMKRSIFATLTLACLMTLSTSASGAGLVGPDPFVNGDFSAAVVGTAIAPGWYAQGTTAGTPNVVFEDVDGDIKARTLGVGGFFGGPTFLGAANERLVYSALFDNITFEVTDLAGASVEDSGFRVILLVYHAVDQEADEEKTSYAIHWSGVSTADAAAGLTMADRDAVTSFAGKTLPFDFTDEELANEFQLGGLKIATGLFERYLDDIAMNGAVLFGTY